MDCCSVACVICHNTSWCISHQGCLQHLTIVSEGATRIRGSIVKCVYQALRHHGNGRLLHVSKALGPYLTCPPRVGRPLDLLCGRSFLDGIYVPEGIWVAPCLYGMVAGVRKLAKKVIEVISYTGDLLLVVAATKVLHSYFPP